MIRMPNGLTRHALLTGMMLAFAPVARAQDEPPVTGAPEATESTPAPLPTLAPTPPATAQAHAAAPQASIQAPVYARGSVVEYGQPMGCGSCGGVHGVGMGCFSPHRIYNQYVPGRRFVRFWDTCKFPLNRLSGPPGYWDSPGPMAGESIVPGAAFDRTPLPVGVMVP